MPTLRTFLLSLLALGLTTATAGPSAPVHYLFATQSGGTTLDSAAGGGNPFATALIELLQRPQLGFADFRQDLASLTRKYSRNHQQPELRPEFGGADWTLLPPAPDERRVALVLVYSDYSKSPFQTLHGARRDLDRVAAALSDTGFVTESLSDPDAAQLQTSLHDFSRRAANADVAAIYLTGHGAEVSGTVYLLPNDYPASARPPAGALKLDRFAATLRARRANLLFFAGCRNNPWDSP